MALAENLAAAEAAINYVKGLNMRSANKIAHRLREAGGVEAVVRAGTDAARQALLNRAGQGVGVTRSMPAGNLNAIAANAETTGYGNCGELAAIAMVHILNNAPAARPVDYMTFSANGYDHAWVVIGLDAGWQNAPPLRGEARANLRAWGADAVWCDPWQGDEGVFFSVAEFVQGKVRNLNAIYKCNTVEQVEKGLPQSLCHVA